MDGWVGWWQRRRICESEVASRLQGSAGGGAHRVGDEALPPHKRHESERERWRVSEEQRPEPHVLHHLVARLAAPAYQRPIGRRAQPARVVAHQAVLARQPRRCRRRHDEQVPRSKLEWADARAAARAAAPQRRTRRVAARRAVLERLPVVPAMARSLEDEWLPVEPCHGANVHVLRARRRCSGSCVASGLIQLILDRAEQPLEVGRVKICVVIHLGDEASAPGKVVCGVLHPRGEAEHRTTEPGLVPCNGWHAQHVTVTCLLRVEQLLQPAGSATASHNEACQNARARPYVGPLQPRVAHAQAALHIVRRRDDADGEDVALRRHTICCA